MKFRLIKPKSVISVMMIYSLDRCFATLRAQ